MYDLLLEGGTVVDGTGGTTYQADVAVKDGRIVALGDLGEAEAECKIDCTGLCVSPGWVDFHGHADWSVLEYPLGLNLLVQGCTTTIAGNCGGAPAPVRGRATDLRKQGKGRATGTAQVLQKLYPQLEWSFADYMAQVEKAQLGVNFVQLAGHNAIRECVMGHDARPATASEIEQMAALVEECLDQGAFGLTSGLVFNPGCWSEPSELVPLCRAVAKRDGFYASHQRGERETNIEATQEIIMHAAKSGVRANISHMQSKYPVYGNGWQKIEMLKAANVRGVDITCDYEDFRGHDGTVSIFLQGWRFTPEKLMRQLSTPEGRAELKKWMLETHPYHPLGRTGPGGVPFRRSWDRVRIFDCPHDRSLEGKTVAAVAAERGMDPEDCIFELTYIEQGKGPYLVNNYIEDEHYRIVPWEGCIVPSIDTGLYDPAIRTPFDFRFQIWADFPSKLGFAPRVLGQWVREEKIMSLAEGVRRMTSLPLSRVGIVDRGYVRPGMWADLTVFNRDTVGMRAPSPNPDEPETCWPFGIQYVVVNGAVAMEGHKHTGARAGKVLRK